MMKQDKLYKDHDALLENGAGELLTEDVRNYDGKMQWVKITKDVPEIPNGTKCLVAMTGYAYKKTAVWNEQTSSFENINEDFIARPFLQFSHYAVITDPR